jgi:2-polyprenyl-6-methoxyphenol hydroxylase-like FAD-dependent oxidoreductase
MDGRDDLGDYERLEFRAALGDVIGDRRYALYVITQADISSVLAPRGRDDRWGLSRERLGDQERLASMNGAQLLALVRAVTGVDDLPATIERTSSFTFAAQIAERYRHQSCFLVGDAAHRMTPRGGTGMNTAIQDSFDLAWKLGWVLRGWASDDILDTYEQDRRPIGLHNVGRTSEPGGARRDTDDALPWDLNGRIAHHWVDHRRTISTVDLIGDGLTVFHTRSATNPSARTVPGSGRPPRNFHPLDSRLIEAYDLPTTGAIMVRPDGREVARSATLDGLDRA